MDNDAILKLSTKKKMKLNLDDSQKIQVQTQLADSMTQRMNIEDKQSELIIQNEDKNSKSNNSKNSKNNDNNNNINDVKSYNSKSVKSSIIQDKDKTPPETPLSQSKIAAINEVINYGINNNGEPENENNLNNSNPVNPSILDNNPLDNVGADPVEANCPFCNSQIQTKVEIKFQCPIIWLIILLIIFFPVMLFLYAFKAGNSGNIFFCTDSSDDSIGCCNCCNDYNHICPSCGKVVAVNDACSRFFSCF